MDRKETLRLLILGDKGDASIDDQLDALIKSVESRLLFILKRASIRRGIKETPSLVPTELDWIVDEVVIKRFNRLGSEGLKSHSVEGERQDFSTSDFQEFLDDIYGFLDDEESIRKRGGRVVIY